MKNIFTIFSFIFAMLFFISCSSSEEHKVKPKGEPLSPGTAQVEAEVLSSSGNEGSISYELRINKVLGYGPSTKPLPEDVTIEVKLSKYLTSQGKKPKVEEVYNFILMNSGDTQVEEVSHWEISKFE